MLTIAAIRNCNRIDRNLSTAPMTVYADESETSTDQSVKQKNIGSGDSLNFNCGQNLIKAGVGEQDCGQEEIEVSLVWPPTAKWPKVRISYDNPYRKIHCSV